MGKGGPQRDGELVPGPSWWLITNPGYSTQRPRETKSRAARLDGSEAPSSCGPTASSPPPSLEVGLPCPEGFNFMRGARGQGARPLLGTELRTGAKVNGARLGAHRAGIRGNQRLEHSPGIGGRFHCVQAPALLRSSQLKIGCSSPMSHGHSASEEPEGGHIIILFYTPTCNPRGSLFVLFSFFLPPKKIRVRDRCLSDLAWPAANIQ